VNRDLELTAAAGLEDPLYARPSGLHVPYGSIQYKASYRYFMEWPGSVECFLLPENFLDWFSDAGTSRSNL